MKTTRTSRGFKIAEFKDIYGEDSSIQESSLAFPPAIWLGCDKETIHKVTGKPCGARMHLDQKLAKKLITMLQRFVRTGRL